MVVKEQVLSPNQTHFRLLLGSSALLENATDASLQPVFALLQVLCVCIDLLAEPDNFGLQFCMKGRR